MTTKKEPRQAPPGDNGVISPRTEKVFRQEIQQSFLQLQKFKEDTTEEDVS